MAKLMILGAGGHGKVVAEVAKLSGKWDEIVFLDDNKNLITVNDIQVVGSLNDFTKLKELYNNAFVALGDSVLRLKLIKKLLFYQIKVPVLVHPFSSISDRCVLGDGTVIMAGAVINCNVSIGRGCIVNTSSSVDHDCILKDGVHISPGAHIGGSVHIGKTSWIGIGSSVRNNLSIISGCNVGAGSVVVKDICNPGTYIGIPAKRVL